MSIRSAFLDFLPSVRAILASDQVRQGWDRPSALQEMTVGMLAGHTLRAVVTIDRYMGGDEPELTDKLIDAATYLTSIQGLVERDGPDLDSPLHREIRERSRQAAEGGHEAVMAQWDETVSRLSATLASELTTRRVVVLGNAIMLLDQYIVTRLIELVVHGDDLTVSVGVEPLDIPDEIYKPIAATLLAAAQLTHGPIAVIRAMTRRERDSVAALRVL